MFCPTCGKEINDGALVCPSCKERVAEQEQSKKLAALEAQKNEAVKKGVNSPLFLINAIALFVIGGFGVINVITSFSGGVFGIILGLISAVPVAFAIVSAVAAIKLFCAKDQLNVGAVGGLAKYPKVMQVFSMIYTVISGILGLIVVWIVAGAASIAGNALDALGDVSDMVGADIGGILGGVGSTIGALVFIIFLIVALIIAFFIISFICYKKTNGYYAMLSKAVNGESYVLSQKPPVVLSFMVGSVVAIVGVIALVSGGFVTGMFYIGIATYLITGALAMNSIKASEEGVAQQITAAQAELERIHHETAAALASEANAQQAAAQQAAAQQQQMQQMMMQQMMQQMMNNQQNNNNDQQ